MFTVWNQIAKRRIFWITIDSGTASIQFATEDTVRSEKYSFHNLNDRVDLQGVGEQYSKEQQAAQNDDDNRALQILSNNLASFVSIPKVSHNTKWAQNCGKKAEWNMQVTRVAPSVFCHAAFNWNHLGDKTHSIRYICNKNNVAHIQQNIHWQTWSLANKKLCVKRMSNNFQSSNF